MSEKDYKLARVSGAPVTDAELLDDLRRIAEGKGLKTISQPLYREVGTYDETTISRRFGSWNTALKLADLELSNEVNISDERLFENILNLWQHFGRQPRRRDLASAPSKISQSPYNRRFGSWTNALQCFVTFINSTTDNEPPVEVINIGAARTTGRDPSLRMRYNVLKRDHFSCQQCGASPAKLPGVELHIDHIVAWSKGGLTTLENLRTLCSKCNLGKGACE